MMSKGWFRAAWLAAILTATTAVAYAADPAVQTVEGFYNTLLDSMKQAKQLGAKGRYEKMKPAVEKAFDLDEMSRASVGPRWAQMTPAEQKAVTAALLRYTVANYAGQFDGYDGEKFVVEPASTERKGDRLVMSKLVTKDKTFLFNYRMRQVGGDWRIIDIFLEGFLSQMAQQRSMLGATLTAGGVPALVKKLDTKSDELMK
jgi:phospholipid transport system substrate-binding protein